MSTDATPEIRQTRAPCTVHGKHVPASHINERHHVWPLGHGGPNTAANIVVVCATGHNNVHDLLKQYLAANGKLPYSVLRRYSFGERELAKLGWERIQRGAL